MSTICFIQGYGLLRTGRTVGNSFCLTSPEHYGNHVTGLRRVTRCNPGTNVDWNDAWTSPRIAVTGMSDSDSKSLSIKIGSVVVLAGLIIGSFLPLAGAIRNATSDAGSSILQSQLSKVPIFTVTDESGRPYMSESEDRRLRRGYFFVQPGDAQKYLELLNKENSDAKVLAVGLDEAYKFLDTKSTAAKAVPERFELFPDDHELEIAQKVTDGEFEQVFGKNSVPLFYMEGLGIQEGKDGSTVYPLFFAKEKLDETVNNLRKKDPKADIDVKDVQVLDLKRTIKEIRAGSNPMLNNVVFVPLEESLAKLRRTSE